MAVGSDPHLSVTNRRTPAQIEMFIVQPQAYITGKKQQYLQVNSF